MVDLTDIGDPSFSYKVRVKNEDIEVTLDHDRVAMEMQANMPTLFQHTGDLAVDKDGKQLEYLEIGIGLVFKNFEAGIPSPMKYPTVPEIMDKLRQIVRVPDGPEIGVKHVMAIFAAWVEDKNKRDALKKGTPASPASQEGSPA